MITIKAKGTRYAVLEPWPSAPWLEQYKMKLNKHTYDSFTCRGEVVIRVGSVKTVAKLLLDHGYGVICTILGYERWITATYGASVTVTMLEPIPVE